MDDLLILIAENDIGLSLMKANPDHKYNQDPLFASPLDNGVSYENIKKLFPSAELSEQEYYDNRIYVMTPSGVCLIDDDIDVINQRYA